MDKSIAYLDYAAATPIDERVVAVMQPYFSNRFYNPSATYTAARSVAKDMQAARATVASVLGARQTEIIYTAGGTEANNLAVHGVMRMSPDANAVVGSIEHESVLQSAAQYTHKQVGVDERGVLNMQDLSEKIDDNTALVSVMYANNEVGTIQPIREIAQIIAGIREERRKAGNKLPLYFHTDAAQAANYLDLHVSRLGVDMMTLNGGKIYGPKQSGVLFVASHIQLKPLVFGGGQERGLRNGTENVAGAVGFSKALELTQEQRQQEVKRLQALQDYFLERLSTEFPQVVINGSRNKRLPNNVHITIPGADNERLLIQFDEAGICAAAGSACSAGDEEPSHVLKAMGISDGDARSSLRFSMGRFTTEQEIDRTVAALASFLN